MSDDDRSPVNGWFRDEPDSPAGGPWTGRPADHGADSPDDAPTQAAAFPAIAPDREPPQGWEPWRKQEPNTLSPGHGQPRYGQPLRQEATTAYGGRAQSAPGPAYGDQQYQPRPADEHPQGRRRTPLIAGGAVAGLTVIGLVAYLAMSNHPSSPNTRQEAHSAAPAASPSPTHTSFQPTAVDPATAAEQTAAAFLNAWQSGDLSTAAKYTDNPTAALAALNSYKSGLNLSALTLKPGPAQIADSSQSAGTSAAVASPSGGASPSPAGTVPFSVTAMVGPGGGSATIPWAYTSSLEAYRQSDGWSVRWAQSVLAPKLADGEKLAVVKVPPSAGKVTDAAGTRLSSYSQTALQNVGTALARKTPSGVGVPGVAVEITDASGNPVDGSATTLKKPANVSAVKTTISPTVESLAAAAVAKNPRSSMVVLRPSTGAILAVANSSDAGDTALTGGLAPGSTFKIVTSTALLDYGYVSLTTPIACPLTFTVQGVVYHNSVDPKTKKEESLPPGTPFITDFAESCNNAFTPFYTQLQGGKLAGTASTYYGLGENWDIGLGPTTYFHMPSDSSGAELAQEDFGQGQIVASPLAMASVAATVGTGSFHQPYLVDGVTKATASPLPSGTDANMKTLMRAVAVSGTAAGVFSGVSGIVYAKTGTADADANKDGKPNAWMVAYSPSKDIAVGVVVKDSGFGATFAGPEAAYLLSRL
jgi:hypothetical protein